MNYNDESVFVARPSYTVDPVNPNDYKTTDGKKVTFFVVDIRAVDLMDFPKVTETVMLFRNRDDAEEAKKAIEKAYKIYNLRYDFVSPTIRIGEIKAEEDEKIMV